MKENVQKKMLELLELSQNGNKNLYFIDTI